MGNHDYYLTQNVRCPRSTIVNQCLEYQKKIILPEYVSWLKDFKMNYENNKISIVHGGWNDYIDEYLEVIDTRLFREKKQSLFFSGHTHKQLYVKGNHFMYCNPGSVGQPRDNDWRASFAILLDSGEIELCRVDYDIEQIIFMMKRARFEERSYINLYSGTKIGG